VNIVCGGQRSGLPVRVLIWNEHVHERRPGKPRDIYPEGIHAAIAKALNRELGASASVRTATLDDRDAGLGDDVLGTTDVLLWWAHLAHDEVPDEIAEHVQSRVLGGMGLVVLHSGHLSKPFRLLMGTSCMLRWREADDRELIWVVDAAHPVARGLPAVMELVEHEMYGERFDIPAPDDLVFISSFSGGEVFRSGCGFHRGRGRIFYFSPGHESYPVYHDLLIGRVLANAVRWVAPDRTPTNESVTSEASAVGWWRQGSPHELSLPQAMPPLHQQVEMNAAPRTTRFSSDRTAATVGDDNCSSEDD